MFLEYYKIARTFHTPSSHFVRLYMHNHYACAPCEAFSAANRVGSRPIWTLPNTLSGDVCSVSVTQWLYSYGHRRFVAMSKQEKPRVQSELVNKFVSPNSTSLICRIYVLTLQNLIIARKLKCCCRQPSGPLRLWRLMIIILHKFVMIHLSWTTSRPSQGKFPLGIRSLIKVLVSRFFACIYLMDMWLLEQPMTLE